MPETDEIVTKTIKGVQIFKCGVQRDSQGREKEWSSDDIANILRTFDMGIPSSVPVKLGHTSSEHNAAVAEGLGLPEAVIGGESETGRGAATLGKVAKLYHDGDILVADLEVPEKVAGLVTEGMFTNVSSEILDDYQGNGATLSGLALLGAERPAVKDLETLTGISVLSDGLIPDHEYIFEFREKKKKKKKKYQPSIGQAAVDVGLAVGTRGRVRRRYAEASADNLHEYATYTGRLAKGVRKVAKSVIDRGRKVKRNIKTSQIKSANRKKLIKNPNPAAFRGRNALQNKPYSKARKAVAQRGGSSGRQATSRQINLKNRYERRKKGKKNWKTLGMTRKKGFRNIGKQRTFADGIREFAKKKSDDWSMTMRLGKTRHKARVKKQGDWIHKTNAKVGLATAGTGVKKGTVSRLVKTTTKSRRVRRFLPDADRTTRKTIHAQRTKGKFGKKHKMRIVKREATHNLLAQKRGKVGKGHRWVQGNRTIVHRSKNYSDAVHKFDGDFGDLLKAEHTTDPIAVRNLLWDRMGAEPNEFQVEQVLWAARGLQDLQAQIKRLVSTEEPSDERTNRLRALKKGAESLRSELMGFLYTESQFAIGDPPSVGGQLEYETPIDVERENTQTGERQKTTIVQHRMATNSDQARSAMWQFIRSVLTRFGDVIGNAGALLTIAGGIYIYRVHIGKSRQSGRPINPTRIKQEPRNFIQFFSRLFGTRGGLFTEEGQAREHALGGLTAIAMGAGLAARAAKPTAKAIMKSPTYNPITVLGAYVVGKKLYTAVAARISKDEPGQIALKTADNKEVQVWAVDPKGVKQEVEKSMPGWQVVQQGLAAGVSGGTEGLISGIARAMFAEGLNEFHQDPSTVEHIHDVNGNPVPTKKSNKLKRIGIRAAKIAAGIVAVPGGIVLGAMADAARRKLSNAIVPNEVTVRWPDESGPAQQRDSGETYDIDKLGYTIHSEADNLFRYKELTNA